MSRLRGLVLRQIMLETLAHPMSVISPTKENLISYNVDSNVILITRVALEIYDHKEEIEVGFGEDF